MPDSSYAQTEMFEPLPARTPEELLSGLSRHCRRRIQLTLTRNRVAMMSMRFDGEDVRLRLDHRFLLAPDDVIRAVGQYLETRSIAGRAVIRAYVSGLVPDGAGVACPLRRITRGRVYDLQAIRDRVNRRHFSGRLTCGITWGRPGVSRRWRVRIRTRRYGSYVKAEDLVRINPVLDDARVPLEFVEYIVFHEMLHAVVPSRRSNGQCRHHHSGFRAMERRYPDIRRMQRLAKELVRLRPGC